MNIALLGSAPSSIMLAPFKDASYKSYIQGIPAPNYPPAPWVDQTWEIWACSPGAFGRVERCTRFFELHRWEPGAAWFSPEYCQWLREFSGPVYTGGPIPEIKNHVVFPIARVEEEFGSYFLTSSLSLMLAMAILEIMDARAQGRGDPDGNDTIGMWGVDMAATEEWAEQRPGCQHFLLEALRRGIRIYVPPESDLLRPMPVYGLAEWDERYIKSTSRMRELNARKQVADQNLVQAQAEVQFMRGAVDDMNYNVKTWCNPYGLPAGVFVKQDPGTGAGGSYKERPTHQLNSENMWEKIPMQIAATAPAKPKAKPKKRR